MARKKKDSPIKAGDEIEIPGEGAVRVVEANDAGGVVEPIETDEQSPAGKNSHPHVGQSCRYTNPGGYVRAAIVEGVDADGYRLAVFDPIERCVRHEHGVSVEAISPVG